MPSDQEPRYEMGISLRVLDHLGLNLYSNTPAVIAEAIANAWDADATQVEVTLDPETNSITVVDNGHGMDLQDINNRYLLVGYRRRVEQGHKTPSGRKPMGRKGIGKLSLFSIANKIFVYTTKSGSEAEAFLMDADEIRATVEKQENEAKESNNPRLPRYNPTAVKFNEDAVLSDIGTTIKITDLKKRLTQASVAGLRKRIARRFGLLVDDFEISINGDPVDFLDRDYYHKVRFIFQYGDYDYARHCINLDRDEENNKPLALWRDSKFDADGKADVNGPYHVEGWIAIARHSNDLDDRTSGQDDNLNKITILMRERVAQEDILQEYRLGGMITKFIFGEIHANFLDEDNEDIATTSRQRLAEDHPRYLALKKFLEGELRYIWTETNKLKAQREFETAVESNPQVKKWYDQLPSALKKDARNIFRGIDGSNMDDDSRHAFYATAVLGFEHLKAKTRLMLWTT